MTKFRTLFNWLGHSSISQKQGVEMQFLGHFMQVFMQPTKTRSFCNYFLLSFNQPRMKTAALCFQTNSDFPIQIHNFDQIFSNHNFRLSNKLHSHHNPNKQNLRKTSCEILDKTFIQMTQTHPHSFKHKTRELETQVGEDLTGLRTQTNATK